jgi:predicted NUDIX family NTP pyrophosphohydrolase
MKQSAGLLLYRGDTTSMEVFLVHPGGPFWAKKDMGAWSIPKGEFEGDEDAASAAKREFKEETGIDVPDGNVTELGQVKASSSKMIHAWAVEADVDPKQVKSNTFDMEWPPKSGQSQQFPEVDKAAWFPLSVAKTKIVKGQTALLEKLAELTGADLNAEPPAKVAAKSSKKPPAPGAQVSLF